MIPLDSPVKVAIIGAGKISRHHLMALRQCKDAKVAGIANRGDPRVFKIQEEFQIPSVFHDYREMLDQVRPDAVYILVNHDQIFEVADYCLQKGVHALIEKPPGRRSAEAKRLAEVARMADVKAMVGFNRRHVGAWKRALATVLSCGPLQGIDVECSENAQRLLDEGIHNHSDLAERLLTNSIHLIDLLNAAGGKVADMNVLRSSAGGFPVFQATIRFESGALGTFRAYWGAAPQLSVKLYGNGVTAELHDNLAQGIIYHRSGQHMQLNTEAEDQKIKPGFLSQTRAFINTLLNEDWNVPSGASLENAAMSMELAEKIGGLT